jgi:hypothetical protein
MLIIKEKIVRFLDKRPIDKLYKLIELKGILEELEDDNSILKLDNMKCYLTKFQTIFSINNRIYARTHHRVNLIMDMIDQIIIDTIGSIDNLFKYNFPVLIENDNENLEKQENEFKKNIRLLYNYINILILEIV